MTFLKNLLRGHKKTGLEEAQSQKITLSVISKAVVNLNAKEADLTIFGAAECKVIGF
ncbi:hypothetical protein [Rhizobium skierniewicense]|nr:hypothetical protein [Rhizobium skierniewicense]NTF31197.1 hypothetical protein [Rhizobium skierniewicense]